MRSRGGYADEVGRRIARGKRSAPAFVLPAPRVAPPEEVAYRQHWSACRQCFEVRPGPTFLSGHCEEGRRLRALAHPPPAEVTDA